MEYTYYAFISYKREDEKWAKWLQKKLEAYGFPTALRKENPTLPSKIRPVFRDQSELSGGNLKDEIEKGLKGSKYLIVVCSPRAAKSPWVSKEVQYFIDHGRENNIIPFIIGGSPNATNPEDECFPEGLRQLSGEKEILGININEMGRDAATIKVIARMFGLRFDTLWQRHERAKRRKRFAIIAGALAFALLSLGVAVIMIELKNQADSNAQIAKEESIRANNERARANAQTELALKTNNSLKIASDSIKQQSAIILRTNQNLVQANRDLAESNRQLAEERDNVLKANWEIMRNQALTGAEKANRLIDDGDSYSARLLCLNLLPKELNNPEIPFVLEVEAATRRAMISNSTLLYTPETINNIAINDDGTLIGAYSDTGIFIWSIKDGRLIHKLNKGSVNALAFSPDKKHIATRDFDGTVSIWDYRAQKQVQIFENENKSYGIGDLCYTHDGKYVISNDLNEKVKIWHTDGRLKETFDGSSFACSPDGNYLMIASYPKYLKPKIEIIDLNSFKTIKIIYGNGNPIEAISVSPWNKSLATIHTDDSSIKLWDYNKGELIGELHNPKNTEMISSISFSNKSNCLASGLWDGSVNIWDLSTGEIRSVYQAHKSKVIAINYFNDKVISGGWDRLIRIKDFQNNILCNAFTYELGGNMSYVLNEKADILALHKDNNEISVYDLKSKNKIAQFKGFGIYSFGNHGRWLPFVSHSKLQGSDFDAISIFDCSSNKFVGTIKDYIGCLALSHNGKYWGYVSKYGIHIADNETNNKYSIKYIHATKIHKLFFSNDDKKIALITPMGYLQIFDWSTGNKIFTYHNDKGLIPTLEFSIDDKYVAFPIDNNIMIYEIRTNKFIKQLSGHIGAIESLSFNYDGRLLVSGSWDGTTKVWDIKSGKCIMTYGDPMLTEAGNAFHVGNVYKASFAEWGDYIVSISDDENDNIRLWHYKPLQKLIQQIKNQFKEYPPIQQ